MNPSLAIYLHIPFCAVRCAYCDFNTYAGLDALFEPYIDALIQEIRRSGSQRERLPVRTIFAGGGTPTVLPPILLARTLDACREAFDVAPGAEVTSEANPGTVDQAHFAALREMGVNRLSMGVQSFDDEELRWLGRMHSAAEAETACEAARKSGFDNINLDFIFGLPGQRPKTWAHTLARAVALGPEHLSLYSLTVEHGTPLADQVQRGLAEEPDDDMAADLYESACDFLARHGYEQYEISNWARGIPSNYRCRHNLVYWRRESYLGFGAGAHSFDREAERRWWNVRPVPEYIRRVEAGRSPEHGDEAIDRRMAMGEKMMLGLRLVQEGVEDASFREEFGVGLEEAFEHEIAGLVQRGLLEHLPGRVRLTPRGRLLGNQVFIRFLDPGPGARPGHTAPSARGLSARYADSPQGREFL
jgi:oxygen-independent coproporphyrinogen-3 oxidase